MVCLVCPVRCKKPAERAGGPELMPCLALVPLGQAGTRRLHGPRLLCLFLFSPGATSIILALWDSKPCQGSLLTTYPPSYLPT